MGYKMMTHNSMVIHSPTFHHEFVNCPGGPKGRGQSVSFVNLLDCLWGVQLVSTNARDDQYTHLLVRESFKWFVPQTPYLVHDTTKAPHIAGH